MPKPAKAAFKVVATLPDGITASMMQRFIVEALRNDPLWLICRGQPIKVTRLVDR